MKTRLEMGDSMSLAEFLYPMLQAWDWWHLYKKYDVRVQIGGGDQFGNILAGVDGVNYMLKNHNTISTPSKVLERSDQSNRSPMGFTVPLLTESSGAKFGKSAGNAIWLDSSLTSPFDLYKVSFHTRNNSWQLCSSPLVSLLSSHVTHLTKYHPSTSSAHPTTPSPATFRSSPFSHSLISPHFSSPTTKTPQRAMPNTRSPSK